jgi:hypothetical protein
MDLNLGESFDGLMQYKWHPLALKYLNSKASIRVIITGNQAGKTTCAMMDATYRMLGIHPVESRNVLKHPIRCVSKSLPKSDADQENAQYVEIRRRYPPDQIKKDVTARSPMMTVKSLKGVEHKIEFMSKNMDIEAFMSVQRSAYYQDEEIEKIKWDECQMRLLSCGGDTTLTLTPVRGLDWTYDHIWCKARNIYRSEAVCKATGLPAHERNSFGRDIDVFVWATDDNPIMKKEDVDRIMEEVGANDDDDTLVMRRYGVFRQVSGRIYKLFDRQLHGLDPDKYFLPDEWRRKRFWFYRIIDYHPTKPWYVSFVAVTPEHEWFVWNELVLRHDTTTTRELRDTIKRESMIDEDSEYNRRTLIDPLAVMKQPNSGFSPKEDLERGEDGLRRVEAADTKNEQGRMNIKHRLKNAIACGKPFNNAVRKEPDPRYGIYLPTIWLMNSCRGHIEHMQNWRSIEYSTEAAKAVHDDKRIIQKWSDFCRNLEFLGALDPVWFPLDAQEYEADTRWFQGRRKVA